MYCVMRASVPSLYNVYRRYDRDDHVLGSMAIHLAHHCFSFKKRDLTPSHDSAHQNTPLSQTSCKLVHGKGVI